MMSRSLTVDLISSDRVTHLAQQYWSPDTQENHLPYDPAVIEDVYQHDIRSTNFSIRRITMLELSQYLENYLWPNYSETASPTHLMSVILLVNEKFRERVPPWTSFEKHPGPFRSFLRQLMRASLDRECRQYSVQEQTHMVIFLNHLYNSIESDLIRDGVSYTVSYNVLECLSEGQLQRVLKEFPNWSKALKRTARHCKKLQGQELEDFMFDTHFLHQLMNLFLDRLEAIGPSKMENGLPVDTLSEDLVRYCERLLEMMIDLESQLPTRRFFNTLLSSCNFLVRCQKCALVQREEGKLFTQLQHILQVYAEFEINDNTGQPLTELDAMKCHYDQVRELQRIIFKKWPELTSLIFASVAAIDSESSLRQNFNDMKTSDLCELCYSLHLLPDDDNHRDNREYLLSVLIARFKKRMSQLEAINRMPLYPTEEIIWDDNIVPSEYYTGDACLALPKLSLQFLTLHDYLLRNFDLFRLESTYEIRQDIEDVVMRLNPWQDEVGNILLRGWARMAQRIISFSVCEVAKPNIGEDKPSRVRADVAVNLSVRRNIKAEWESLRKHDVCFLVSLRGPKVFPDRRGYIPEEFGIRYVRGCEIEGMLDENGRVIEDGPEPKPILKGDTRGYRVWLDCNQYKIDMDRVKGGGSSGEDVYETFTLLMRRKPKENNFKAVLETIRDLMNTKCVVPDWLLDIILGYGDPGAAHYNQRENALSTLDFNDTFLNYDHLKSCFPGSIIRHPPNLLLVPPFKLTFEGQISSVGNKKKMENGEKSEENVDQTNIDDFEKAVQQEISVVPYTVPCRGPYPYTVPKKNLVQFTATQTEAIRSGMQPGLTVVVGPPGTGKTDVAVQIISNIYHSNPNERTLIVTHSNQALNQLFEKIMALDVDERHLLRLGHGEESLETEKDFSRYGRVNYVLSKRLELLDEVTRLKESLGVGGEMGASCETAGYFFLQHVLARWERYISAVTAKVGQVVLVESLKELFPFHVFFSNAPQPLFKGKNYEEDMEIACGCFRYLENIFTQLKEFRAFEMLRSGLDRTRYLLVKEAKIIAMTCTHAALKRRELVELGFQFDNILMEESAQILEIETFIPLLLQNPGDGRNRLKRWVMIGDHHQLPPVIKNMAFQKFSNMEQSLFTRFVRLGVPVIQLDAQGRARPTICALYKWRYKNLGDLAHVTSLPEFKVGNPGMCFDYQLINVDDLGGRGESEPRRYFFQNLAEAEYMVHLYMYMRLLGYPASSISLLTTYNGQKELLKDVVEQRCAQNPLLGRPGKISTVDKYQGQQNDYILLSLVRTRVVGHLRDVRRLVVAMSRARKGLYIFGRVGLFKNCYELQPVFELLTKRPLELHLAPHERVTGFDRPNGAPTKGQVVVQDVNHMSHLVHDLYGHVCATYQSQISLLEPGTISEDYVPPDTGARYDSDDETEKSAEKEEDNLIVNEIQRMDE